MNRHIFMSGITKKFIQDLLKKIRLEWLLFLMIIAILSIFCLEFVTTSNVKISSRIDSNIRGFERNPTKDQKVNYSGLPSSVKHTSSLINQLPQQGIYVSPWYKAGTDFNIAVSGYPFSQPGISLWIERRGDTENSRMNYSLEPPEATWKNWRISVDKNIEFRIVAENLTTDGKWWLGVSDPYYDFDHGPIQDLVFTAMLLLLAIIIVKLYIGSYENLSNVYEISIIFAVIAIFFDAAIFSSYSIKDFSNLIYIFVLLINLGVIVSVYTIVKVQFGKFKNKHKAIKVTHLNILESIYNKGAVFVIMLVYFLVKLHYADTVPIHDAAMYTKALADAVHKFDFHFLSFVNNFSIFKHNTMGYMALAAITQFFDNGNYVLVNIQNTFVSCISIYTFFKIICFFFEYDKFRHEVNLITLMFAFNPLYFGSSLTLNSEYPYLIFICISFYCLIYARKTLFVFCTTILMFTKEVGALMGIVLICSESLFILMKNYKNFVNLKIHAIKKMIYTNFYLLLPLVSFMVYYLLVMRQNDWQNLVGSNEKSTFNTFIYDKNNVIASAIEMFVFNFNWILTLFIILYLLKTLFMYLTRKRISFIKQLDEIGATMHVYLYKARVTLIKNHSALATIIFTGLTYYLFYFSFYTYAHVRYKIAIAFFNTLFFFVALNGIFKNRKIKLIILSLTSIIFVISTFFSMDLITFKAFSSSIMKAPISWYVSDFSGKKVYPLIEANAQYAYPTKLFNKFFQTVKFSPNDNLLLANGNESTLGLGEEPSYFPVYKLDNKTSAATHRLENSFYANTHYVNSLDSLYNTLVLPNDIYFVYLDWAPKDVEETYLSHLKQHYQLVDTYSINIDGYILRAYKMHRSLDKLPIEVFSVDKTFKINNIFDPYKTDIKLPDVFEYYLGSWSGSDANTGKIVSTGIKIDGSCKLSMAVLYENNPAPGLSLGIDTNGDDIIDIPYNFDTPIDNQAWRIVNFDLSEYIGKEVRIIANDEATGWGGWFGFSQPIISKKY